MIIGLIGTVIGVVNTFLYKRQIVSICRQIHYINKEKSNLLLTRDIATKEFDELIEEINKMMIKLRDDRNIIENKDKELKETITNISHDIRTPLTSLNGYFELLRNTDNEEDRERYYNIIKDRINSLKDMLEQLFTYLKLQNGEYKFEMEEIDVCKELTSILVGFYGEFKKCGIEPIINIPDEKVIKELNQLAFRRVFENIVKNSLEHGKSYFELTMENNDDNVIITVKNDINDVDDIQIDKVFNRFYKADKSRNQTSSGLGLAVAHDMVEKMNGIIKAEIEDDLFAIKIIFT
jgi:signal transduction histidine kinase